MRKSGVLLHISSLPSPYGIGTMGKAAYEFIDFLKNSGQSCWQILPTYPTNIGDSPYSSFSTFAGNPYFIDLDMLVEDGLLNKEDFANISWFEREDCVEYGVLSEHRLAVLRIACSNLLARDDQAFRDFCMSESHWLEDLALYISIKEAYNDAPWYEWDAPLKFRSKAALIWAKSVYKDNFDFYCALQYLFFSQWNALHAYAAENGISIIGDIPIYTALDSADVWGNPKQFLLDEDLKQTYVAGVPPDGFSSDGQLWGNPLFDWDYMAQHNYDWFVMRISHSAKMFDKIRIDHFRGFDSFYAIPSTEKTAANGIWMKGPGMALFNEISKRCGEVDIIAEDLGFLTPDVKKLLKDSGYPGMLVLQFAFDAYGDSDYLPHNHSMHKVVYTGTHDNDTILGWMNSASQSDVEYAKAYLRLDESQGYNWGMMCAAWASVAELAIVQMQDLLGLDNSARMNTPSTVGQNWKWRMLPGSTSDDLAQKLRWHTHIYRRI